MPSTTQSSNKLFFILAALTCLSIGLSFFTILRNPSQDIKKLKQDIISSSQDIKKLKQDNIRFVSLDIILKQIIPKIEKKLQEDRPNEFKILHTMLEKINKFNKDKLELNDSETKEKNKLEDSINTMVEKMNSDLNNNFSQILYDTIKELSKENKYDSIIILPKKNLYLLDSKLDITSAVLEKIENKLP